MKKLIAVGVCVALAGTPFAFAQDAGKADAEKAMKKFLNFGKDDDKKDKGGKAASAKTNKKDDKKDDKKKH
jgi:Ni/Co efflux regulator RcnB